MTPEPPSEPRDAVPEPPPQQQGHQARHAAGGAALDVGTLSSAWQRILEAVKQRSRATWMILTGYKVEVAGVDGNGSTVQLGFSDESGARGFTSNGNNRIVEAAIGDVLGIEVRVTAAPANAAQVGRQRAASSQPTSPARATPAQSTDSQPEPATAPPEPEPDPPPEPDTEVDERAHEPDIDEPVPDVDGNADTGDSAPEPDPSPEPDVSGETSGAVLIEQELGGKVIDEIDHTG